MSSYFIRVDDDFDVVLIASVLKRDGNFLDLEVVYVVNGELLLDGVYEVLFIVECVDGEAVYGCVLCRLLTGIVDHDGHAFVIKDLYCFDVVDLVEVGDV